MYLTYVLQGLGAGRAAVGIPRSVRRACPTTKEGKNITGHQFGHNKVRKKKAGYDQAEISGISDCNPGTAVIPIFPCHFRRLTPISWCLTF